MISKACVTAMSQHTIVIAMRDCRPKPEKAAQRVQQYAADRASHKGRRGASRFTSPAPPSRKGSSSGPPRTPDRFSSAPAAGSSRSPRKQPFGASRGSGQSGASRGFGQSGASRGSGQSGPKSGGGSRPWAQRGSAKGRSHRAGGRDAAPATGADRRQRTRHSASFK